MKDCDALGTPKKLISVITIYWFRSQSLLGQTIDQIFTGLLEILWEDGTGHYLLHWLCT